MPRRFAPRQFPTISQKVKIGGGGGIRTHGAISDTTVFKTVALDHSATPPCNRLFPKERVFLGRASSKKLKSSKPGRLLSPVSRLGRCASSRPRCGRPTRPPLHVAVCFRKNVYFSADRGSRISLADARDSGTAAASDMAAVLSSRAETRDPGADMPALDPGSSPG